MSESTFWSRRQAAVAQEARAQEAKLQAAEVEQAEAALAERDDAEILQELELPAPEALESPEAVREFLQAAVPQRLKTRALRTLWRLNPVLANLDGLLDYGEDFTDSAMVIENMQTAYQVGKGMLAHVEALAAKLDPPAEGEEDLAPEADADAALLAADEGAEDPADAVPNEDPIAAPYQFEDAQDDTILSPPRRRMTFHFETTA